MSMQKADLGMDKKENTNSKIQIDYIRNLMTRMQEESGTRHWNTWHTLSNQLSEAYKSEEEYQAKKSRIEWLHEGDKNTKFFHVVTAQKRKRNRIMELEKLVGGTCKDEQD